jgi:hypothetical protein
MCTTSIIMAMIIRNDRPYEWRQYAPLKRRSIFTRLHEAIFQKAVILAVPVFQGLRTVWSLDHADDRIELKMQRSK